MTDRRSLLCLWTGRCGVLATVLIFLPVASAAPTDKNAPKLWLVQAQQAEDQGNWAAAVAYYADVLAADRNQPQVRDRFLLCLRHLHRQYRLVDSSFQYQVNALRWPREALEFYKDVLLKVQDSYPEAAKKDLARLFREGLVELRLSLEDPKFLAMHLPQANLMQRVAFLEYLRQRERENTVLASPEQVADEARKVARRAAKELRLNLRVAVAEMACGACNALDEYSYYLSQGYLSMAGREEKSVIEARIHETGIGYVRLDRFVEGSTLAELDAALSLLVGQGMKTLVLDLRFNEGGSLREAVYVAARFIPSSKLIAASSGKINGEYRSTATMVHEMPLVVLVQGSTASAAELLAAAFKAHRRAELVGLPTYGKSLIQKDILLTHPPYGAIRITWAHFYVPSPADPSKLEDVAATGGVTPTVRVEPGTMGDTQFQTALQRARLAMSLLSMR